MEETVIFYQHRGQQPRGQGWGAVLGTSANSWENRTFIKSAMCQALFQCCTYVISFNMPNGGFPCGAVVGNPSANAGDTGSRPGP